MVNLDPAERDSEVMKTCRMNENYAGVYGTVVGRASYMSVKSRDPGSVRYSETHQRRCKGRRPARTRLWRWELKSFSGAAGPAVEERVNVECRRLIRKFGIFCNLNAVPEIDYETLEELNSQPRAAGIALATLRLGIGPPLKTV